MTKKPQGSAAISKKELERHRCLDCGVNVIKAGEYYMLIPQIWEGQLGLGWHDNLCLGCVEKRLGRRLRGWRSDTPDFMLSGQEELLRHYPASKRYVNRLGFDPGKRRRER
jgi:hypothetical protein